VNKVMSWAAAISVIAVLAVAIRGGPLNPPSGAIQSTYKTLTDIEPRTIVQSLPSSGTGQYLISQSGSYYLGANIVGIAGKNGIEIAVDGVTLDLRGFRLLGVTGSQSGIATVVAVKNTTIQNGVIQGWGSAGITSGNSSSTQIFDVAVTDNQGSGLGVGNGCLLRNCIAVNNSLFGMSGEQRTRIIDCIVRSNGWRGIDVADDSYVSGTIAASNTQGGIDIYNNCTVKECITQGNGGAGIIISGSRSTVSGNACDGNADSGIWAQGNNSRIEENTITSNGIGVHVSGTGCLIVRNSIRLNTSPQSIVAGNAFGPFVVVTGVGDLSSVAAANHPLANLVY
jgi:parallel beta-helix repeat protein